MALTCGIPVLAQSVRQTADHDTKVHDGVATTSARVIGTSKRKTHRPKKSLDVGAGPETVAHKTIWKSSVRSDGDHSGKVKTSR